jgi:hypothetical protein
MPQRNPSCPRGSCRAPVQIGRKKKLYPVHV